MPYPMQIDSDGGVADLDVYWIFYSVQENKTSAEIQAFVGNTASAGSYGYELQIKGFPFTGTYTQPTVTQSTASYIKFNITSLVPGTTYMLKVRAYSGSGMTGNYGLTQYTEFTVPKTTTLASILETFHKKQYESEEYDNGTGTIIPSGNEVDELSKKIGAIEAALALNSEKGVERTTKSLFKLSNNSKDPDNYSVAYKTYSSLAQS